MLSAMNLFMQRPDGSLALRTTVDVNGTLVHMGELALAAGVCTVAAGIWNSRKGRAWLLVLNGLALSALGCLFTFWANRQSPFVRLRSLIVVMAISIGIYELAVVRTSRRHVTAKWLLGRPGWSRLVCFGVSLRWRFAN